MRRHDREITDPLERNKILSSCDVLHLALIDEEKPYLVAVNFGHEWQEDTLILYFHSATEGRKIDILQKNPFVAFQMESECALITPTSTNPCRYSWHYSSIVGYGCAEFISDPETKTHALNRIIHHLDPTQKQLEFPQTTLMKTCVIRIVVTEISAKHHI